MREIYQKTYYLLFLRKSDSDLEKYIYEGGIFIESVKAEKPNIFCQQNQRISVSRND